MSVYNAEKYLDNSIQSILAQTLKDFEFIIVDDGSTDGSNEIINLYSADPRVKPLHNEVNIGLTKSLNKAISVARGEFIVRMDADDISLPSRLERQVTFMERHSNVGVIGSNYYEIDEEGRKIGEVILPTDDSQIRKAIFKFNPFNHGAVMIRRKALNKSGLYNEELIHAQDYELWFRILKFYKGYNFSEKLLLKRNPKGSITVARKRKQIYYSLMAWRMGRRHISNSIMDYRYYLRLKLMYLIPSFMIPILRNAFTRQKYRSQNRYYVVNLVP